MWNARSVVRGSWLVATVSAIVVAIAIVIASHPTRPDTKRIDALLALADSYFDNHDLANAERTYREVIESPRSSAYWYAMYKLGLIDFDLRRFHEAAEKLSEVVQGTKDDQELLGLHRSSTTELVRTYAEIGEPKTAYPAFQRVDQERALDMLETLADFYMSQGKSDHAIYVYQELMTTAPTHNHVCLWQYNVAHVQLSMTGTSNAVTQIENLVRLSTALHRKNLLPAVEGKECHDNAQAMAGELARAYHSEAARTKSAETLGYAERLYEVYLEAFPDAEDFAQTQYFYAELLWSRAETTTSPQQQIKRWENAADAFTEVVKTRRVDAKLMRESAYAAVLAWKNALAIEPGAEPKSVTQTHDDKAPIPDTTRKLLAAIDAYITIVNNPNDDDVIGAKLIAANTYRRYNHFDEAIPLFEDILAHHPEHETAEFAANLLLDTFNRLGRYDDMLAVIDSLVASPKFLDGKSDAWLVQLRDKGIPLGRAEITAKRKQRDRSR